MMKRVSQKIIAAVTIGLFALSMPSRAQVCEWQLANVVHSNTDPDGAGPATGSVTFDLRVHTVSGTINNVNVLSLGWSWQTAKAMVPASPACAILSAPANITLLPPFSSSGFTFTTVNQCNPISQTTGGQTFDRRVTGTLDGGIISLTTTWVDVMRVTLWSLTNTGPQGGYAVINSSNGGAPVPFGTYSISDNLANEYIANSLSYTSPVPLGTPVAGTPDLTIAQDLALSQINPGGFIDEAIVIRNIGSAPTSGPIIVDATVYSALSGLLVSQVPSGTVMINGTPYTASAGWSFDALLGKFTSNMPIPPGGNSTIWIRITRSTGPTAGAPGIVNHTITIPGFSGGEQPAQGNNNSINNPIRKN